MIERRGRSADSRRVALAVDARRDSPKSSSCSRAARTWAARARSRESSQARVRGRPRAAAVPAPVVGRAPSDHLAAQLLVLGQRDQVAAERGPASSTGPFVVIVGAARFHRHYADIVEPWVRCARVEACIAPPGSNRRNHRQDQAALTVLAHQAGVACRRMHLSVHYHHDDPSDEGTLDGRPKSSRPKSSRRPAGGD